jgi:hypothetical protein
MDFEKMYIRRLETAKMKFMRHSEKYSLLERKCNKTDILLGLEQAIH